jgi:hypothetical protein
MGQEIVLNGSVWMKITAKMAAKRQLSIARSRAPAGDRLASPGTDMAAESSM